MTFGEAPEPGEASLSCLLVDEKHFGVLTARFDVS